MASEQ